MNANYNNPALIAKMRYNWENDPNGWKVDGHRPKNRCYVCGSRFLGSQFAAFCNICDNAMSPEIDEMMVLIKTGDKEAHLVPRKALVATRIRIPEDSNDKDFADKINKIAADIPPKPSFVTADRLDAFDERTG